MQYIGSKNKIAKHLLPLMLEARGERTWVEPFVGGANMIDKVSGKRIGNDTHKYLIALHKAIQNDWIPPTEVTRELYYDTKENQHNNKYSCELIGFCGFLCSFGAKWWGGYATNNSNVNYADRGKRMLTKQAKNLKGIDFVCGSYLDLEIPPNSLIYCDPPYANSTSYSDTKTYTTSNTKKNEFNHVEFWQWCRDKVNEGHIVFISEYNAPEDFICVKEVKYKCILDKNSNYERTEKLFVYKQT